MKFRTLGVSGFRDIHYLEWGSRKAKRVVVCVHGYSGNARDFDYLARDLARDARVICIDIAGRGDSDWLASGLGYHFGTFTADIEALLAHLGLKNVDWVGTSMGGLIGLLLASRPSNPIRSLVMNDIGAFVPLDALQAIARNLEAPERFATLEDVEKHIRHTHREWGELTDEQWRHFAVHGSRPAGDGYRMHYDPRIARVAQPFPLSPGIFVWDAWYRVRCPVLLLRGEDSDIFPAAVADTMLDVKPDAELAEIPGCGHVPALMSGPQIAIVRNFILHPADKAQWSRQSSSSRGSSKTRTGSSSRSRTSPGEPTVPSPT
jgi:pimeloyl-ACP methyl ester carboxylesterase